MATDYKMTWRAKEQRWRKKYKGKEFYFPAPEGKVKSYRRCYQEWLTKKAEVDNSAHAENPHERAWRVLIDRATDKLLELQEDDTPENRQEWSFWFAQVQTYQRMLSWGMNFFGEEEPIETEPEKIPLVIAGEEYEPGPPPWESKEVEPVPDAAPSPETIGGNVRRFLDRKKLQVERGKLSHGQYEILRVCLEDFMEHRPGFASKPIAAINGTTLVRYRDYVEDRLHAAEQSADWKPGKGTKKKKISASYANRHLQVVKQFVNWCWQHELIELPRILKSREFVIAVPQKQIEIFSPEEVKALMEVAPENTRLHLLLMLNCGFYQQDVADLRHDEVDWRKGRIIRKRSKTGDKENVPEVNYLLWPETFRLLKKHRSENAELALTNRDGNPLRTEHFGSDGKTKKTDNIKNSFDRIVRKLANRKQNAIKIAKPLKLLRKTAASKLNEHAEYGRFHEHFLGHAPRTVAGKHYVRPSEDQFDRAVTWLGEALGMIETPGSGDSRIIGVEEWRT